MSCKKVTSKALVVFVIFSTIMALLFSPVSVFNAKAVDNQNIQPTTKPTYAFPCKIDTNGKWKTVLLRKKFSTDAALLLDINTKGIKGHSSGAGAIDLNTNTNNLGPRTYGICQSGYIYTAAEGKVMKVGWDAAGYGNYVKIRHANGQETIYAHMKEKSKLIAGQTYPVGTLVGIMGCTGNCTGTHLHFEVKVNNVRTANWKFALENPSTLPSPILESPVNGLEELSDSVLFSWKAVTGATKYRLQVSTTNSFSTIEKSAVVVAPTVSYYLQPLPTDTQHYWRVRGETESGVGAWSQTYSFTLHSGKAKLISPSNGAQIQKDANVLFDWDPVFQAEQYFLDYGTGNSGFIATTEFNAGTLSPGTYTWKVLAIGPGLDEGVWSDEWTFTVTEKTIVVKPQIYWNEDRSGSVGQTNSDKWPFQFITWRKYGLRVNRTSGDAVLRLSVYDSNHQLKTTSLTGSSVFVTGLEPTAFYYVIVDAVSGSGDYNITITQPPVTTMNQLLWGQVYAGKVNIGRFEQWPFMFSATRNFKITVTRTSGNAVFRLIVLDSAGNPRTDIGRGEGATAIVSGTMAAGNYFVLVQPVSGNGDYSITITQTP